MWCICLDAPDREIARLRALLSLEERAQTARLRRNRDRLRYVIAHGTLRQLLSEYAAIAPEELQFGRNPKGKPHLLVESRPSHLQFSLSHSEDRALVVVAHGQPVGVDIQRIDPDIRALSIAERFFSANERNALRALPPRRRLDGFFRLWVCKEAYVKARGETIAGRLPSFAVTIDALGRACLVEDAQDPDAPKHWCLGLLECGQGFAAAVVSTSPCGNVALHEWPDGLGG